MLDFGRSMYLCSYGAYRWEIIMFTDYSLSHMLFADDLALENPTWRDSESSPAQLEQREEDSSEIGWWSMACDWAGSCKFWPADLWSQLIAVRNIRVAAYHSLHLYLTLSIRTSGAYHLPYLCEILYCLSGDSNSQPSVCSYWAVHTNQFDSNSIGSSWSWCSSWKLH